jgi:hypothetical protein
VKLEAELEVMSPVRRRRFAELCLVLALVPATCATCADETANDGLDLSDPACVHGSEVAPGGSDPESDTLLYVVDWCDHEPGETSLSDNVTDQLMDRGYVVVETPWGHDGTIALLREDHLVQLTSLRDVDRLGAAVVEAHIRPMLAEAGELSNDALIADLQSGVRKELFDPVPQ